MVDSGQAVTFDLVHRFVPGLYIREIHMPAGSLLTSKVHNTEHPYVVTAGRVSVLIPDAGVEHISAPHFGITKPGTRRLLLVHEATTWITFHPITEAEYEARNVTAIEARIIDRREIRDGKTAYELAYNSVGQPELAEPPPQLDYGGAP